MALSQQEFEQLQVETIKRIKAIEQAKKQVASQAAQLIAKIEQTRIACIEKLDSLIQSYRAYIAENNYDQQALQNIAKMLTTRLKIQIDEDLALNLREEPKEEKKSAFKQPIEVAETKRATLKEPKIEEEKKKYLKQPIRESYTKKEPPKEPKLEEPKRETRNEPQAKQLLSNQIIRKRGKSQRQNCILSAAKRGRLRVDCR
jgi:hypothetical protein